MSERKDLPNSIDPSEVAQTEKPINVAQSEAQETKVETLKAQYVTLARLTKDAREYIAANPTITKEEVVARFLTADVKSSCPRNKWPWLKNNLLNIPHCSLIPQSL